VIDEFAKQYMQMGFVKIGLRFARVPIKVYGEKIKDGQEFRFHRGQYQPFLQFLRNKQIPEHAYQVHEHTPFPGEFTDYQMMPGWSPRDYQEPIIDYCCSDVPSKQKLVEVQTGKGKTSMLMFSAARLKVRMGLILPPQFIPKWVGERKKNKKHIVGDLEKLCGITPDRIAVAQGLDALMTIVAEAKAGILDCDAVVFSAKTLQLWFKEYKEHGRAILDQGWDCLPGELFQTLGIGLRAIDEVHMSFHLNFMIDLYTHVDRSIALSATLISDDPFTMRMFQVAYPNEMRYNGLEYDRYVHAYSWLYRVDRPDKIRTMARGSIMYSHNEFEESIMRQPKVLEGYLDMIIQSVKTFYLDMDYVPGDKCLIYCTSIKMCSYVTEHVRACYPNKDVRRYVEDDPYENLMNAEICVATLLGAGTGHDIDGLTTVILTTAIMSSSSNIQGFGRLRKKAGRKMKFVYFTCIDVLKHVEYHEKKQTLLTAMALEYNSRTYPIVLGAR
jgi:hypothetical protein